VKHRRQRAWRELKVEIAHETLGSDTGVVCVTWLDEDRVRLRKRLKLYGSLPMRWDASGRDNGRVAQRLFT
jgi:hypothetical protein